MRQTFIFSLRILFSGIILPYRIWQFSKEKLISNAGNNSVKNLLDRDYIVTSWFDWLIDAIIFLLYPIGLIFVVIGVMAGSFVTKFSLFGILVLIPLYFIPLILSFARELGGSFMLLHLNVKRIRNLLEENKSVTN